ncbi:hypothetical protein RvY_08068 [Ramazzottius varieornatus]|uniref:Uncharacterized protein n=1 Tax=Ramazzottius varieornatus TaxID=947166 RepID=A0A1D1V6X2_RAMVA|nr:hypothetical protein RvY_08068 [Ramazzottius varieornatus]
MVLGGSSSLQCSLQIQLQENGQFDKKVGQTLTRKEAARWKKMTAIPVEFDESCHTLYVTGSSVRVHHLPCHERAFLLGRSWARTSNIGVFPRFTKWARLSHFRPVAIPIFSSLSPENRENVLLIKGSNLGDGYRNVERNFD